MTSKDGTAIFDCNIGGADPRRGQLALLSDEDGGCHTGGAVRRQEGGLSELAPLARRSVTDSTAPRLESQTKRAATNQRSNRGIYPRENWGERIRTSDWLIQRLTDSRPVASSATRSYWVRALATPSEPLLPGELGYKLGYNSTHAGPDQSARAKGVGPCRRRADTRAGGPMTTATFIGAESTEVCARGSSHGARRLRQISGIDRAEWESKAVRSADAASSVGQSRARAGPTSSAACAVNVSVPTSTVILGLALRL